ncbi:MAG: HAD-IIIA family hydrolase [Gammaproteobacteria bacterium]|nr:HAD-IIIA family hydrolase [Gammaproteobacteria bacterium]NNF62452.1 HAD-IIIA family hydrolase [Gammaproteobacteria bacterium]NNM21804.1 HAD-IIIA family hydrolase [Gammaproteobacteria bacterium]
MTEPDQATKQRASAIRLVAIDVDGVLTDGRLYYCEDGEHLKVFHVHDGLGLRRLMSAGIKPVIISARKSKAVKRRMKELGVADVYMHCADKGERIEAVMREAGVTAEQVAAIGDDLADLPMLQRAGLAVTVANGHPRLKEIAHWVTSLGGGEGAVRELCDLILAAQNYQ